MTSLEREADGEVTMRETSEVVARSAAEVFGLSGREMTLATLDARIAAPASSAAGT
jgi:hypothetical protein